MFVVYYFSQNYQTHSFYKFLSCKIKKYIAKAKLHIRIILFAKKKVFVFVLIPYYDTADLSKRELITASNVGLRC